MNRRQFLQTGTGLAVMRLMNFDGRSAESEKSGRSLTPEGLLASAQANIEKFRQGPATVVVRGASGQRIAGAKVKVEQTCHEFLFGCNLFRFGHIADPTREEAYRQRFADLLNYATLGFYWPMYEPRRGEPIYEYTDKVVAWCRERHITCKGHPLVWDFADPRWLPQEFSEIRALSHQRVRDIVGRFAGRLDFWDVVNEPTHLGRFKTRFGEWAMSMPAADYVGEHLKIARAANAKATLLVNDYRTDPPYYRILDSLRDEGKLLFNAIGIQSHMHGGGWKLPSIWDVCDTYAKIGLPIHFTETTIVSGPRVAGTERWGATTPEGEVYQADYVPQFYTVLFGHPAVQAITWWDFSDDAAWQGAPAGWIRKDMSPKPVYERLMALIKGRWWTRKEGQTDAQGTYQTNAFYGTYQITVATPDGHTLSKNAQITRHQPGPIEMIVEGV